MIILVVFTNKTKSLIAYLSNGYIFYCYGKQTEKYDMSNNRLYTVPTLQDETDNTTFNYTANVIDSQTKDGFKKFNDIPVNPNMAPPKEKKLSGKENSDTC